MGHAARSLGSCEFRLLGPVEFVVDGVPLALGGIKQRAVLAMLALRLGTPVSMAHLVEGLWGDDPPASAVNTLQSYVSRLRGLVGRTGESGGLISRPGGYVLLGDPESVDVFRFELAAGQGRLLAARDPVAAASVLREALAMWRGSALSDVLEVDFARPEAARLEELRLVTTEELFDAELAAGHHGDVVPRLEALVVAHPLRERMWAQLALALYRSGRQADSLRAVGRVRAELREQLGIEPGAALKLLERQILEQASEIDRRPPPQPAPQEGTERTASVLPGRELFGRNDELVAVESWLQDVERGAGRVVLVSGDAGIGKTALVGEITARAQRSGAGVVWGRAWEEEGAAPFWPWIEVLHALSDEPTMPPVRGAASSMSRDRAEPAVATVGGAHARLRWFDEVASRLARAAEKRPLVVVLEDLHGTDAATLMLLQFVARRLAGTCILVLATHRPPSSASSPLVGALAELTREPATRTITLGPLTDDAVTKILETGLSHPVTTTFVSSVQHWAEGHPFFLTELVHLLQAQTAPGQTLRVDRIEVPQGVRHVIARRFAMLSDDVSRVLAAASAIGREFTVRLVRRITPLAADAVDEALAEAAAAQLIDALPPPAVGYRFRHVLVREALYDGLGPVRRARLHHGIAEAIEAGVIGPADGHISELAFHRCASAAEGGAEQAVVTATQAAARATSHLAYEEAIRLCQAGLETLDHEGGNEALRGPVLYELADAQQRLGDVAAARGSFLNAAATARSCGDIELLARVVLGLGRGFEAFMYDPELVQLLEECLANIDSTETSIRARLLARLAMAVYLNDPDGRRVDLSGEALAEARRSGDDAVVAEALSARYFALWGAAHADERMEAATETLQLARRLGYSDLALDGLTWTMMELLERGDRHGFDVHAQHHARLADDVRHPLHRYYAGMWQAMAAALDGRLAEAEGGSHRAFQLGEQLTELAMPRRSVLLLVVFREQERLAELVDDVDRVVRDYPLFRSSWGPGRVLVRLELGDEGPARQLLDESRGDIDDHRPRDANWMSRMVFLTEICALVGDQEAASALYPRLVSYADRCAFVRFAPACWGAVSRYLGVLAHVAGDLPTAERHLVDAIQRNDDLGATVWAAWSRHDLAAVVAAGGDRERAAALRRQATDIADDLQLTRLARRLMTENA